MNAVHPGRPVVVGVDGSEASLAAVDWAVGEAVARQCWLRVVHAFIWPLFPHVPLGPSPYGPSDGGLRAVAEEIVEESVKRATNGASGLRVDGDLITGAAEPVMLTEASSAQLVVVASRGVGGFTGLLVGSVSSHLAAHATCPVVVIRPARAMLTGGGNEPRTPSNERADVTAVRRLLGDAATVWQQKYPEVRTEAKLVSGSPARTLIDLSRRAVVLVVGSHGSGGFRGMLLGSVSQQVLHHAATPVAIVRGIEPTGKRSLESP